MITWNAQKLMTVKDGKAVVFGYGSCLSTDEKPTEGIYNGSELIEMDTGTRYMFDAESGTWKAVAASGGGGGGGSTVFATPEEVREVLNGG